MAIALIAATTVGLAGTPAAAAPAAADPLTSPTSLTSPARSVPASLVPTIAWGSCGAEHPAFQCATVQVPLDYDRPYGKKTSIAVTRLPASDPSRRIGTLFTNPGGPGGSGVAFVQQLAQRIYPASIRARFDILGFDPRGVAGSDPATCFPTAAEEQAALAGTLIFPRTTAEERRYVAESKALARNCATTSPDRFRHFSTANVARDMDLLRRAVGDRKLSYAGYSYGTFLGATYAKLFPNRIRALVLDGTLDPREYTGFPSRYHGLPVGNRVEQDRGGAEVFAEFLRQCRLAGPGRCSLATLGDPETVARATLDTLKRQPRVLTMPDGTTVELSYQLTVALMYSALYSPSDWSALADLLSTLSVPATAQQRSAAERQSLAALVRRLEDYPSIGGALSVCVDTYTPKPRAYPAVADRQDQRFPDFGRYRTWIDLPCYYLKQYGIRDHDAYTGPWRQSTKTPVLVLGTRFDPATPYKNTRPSASLFPRASVVTLEGWGHTTLGQSACTNALVANYLLDPGRPPRDTTCATDVRPFTAPSASARTQTQQVAARLLG